VKVKRIHQLLLSPEGGALESSDYVPLTGRRIRWAPNAVDPRTTTANDAPFNVMIVNDDIAEPTEYFEVHFTVETTGYAFPDAVARVTILDDDGGEGSVLRSWLNANIPLSCYIQWLFWDHLLSNDPQISDLEPSCHSGCRRHHTSPCKTTKLQAGYIDLLKVIWYFRSL